ncbi:MAG TPA: tRNA pseudouridine(55) synthase TruB [Nocardioides sp.]|nr:tRNA pseudouridine(55) synthase TruB [Nocardioides sp.]
MTDESGLVIVDKPGGMTSHDVVSRVRRLAGTRKVGHAGTLDPMATGVLVLGLNRATRLLGHLTLTDKRYDATVRLGAATTTDDAEGEILETRATDDLTGEAVRAALAGFVGEIAQVPSAVSAVKVDGKRAYARVRAGETVDLPPRRVTVHALEVTGLDLPDVRISIHCSSGTYVRALARDVGAVLGVGGHLTALRRTAVGPFDLAAASTLEALTETFALTPIADAARAGFPTLDLDEDQARAVRVGRRLDLPLGATTALFAPDGEFLALYGPGDGEARALAVFV